MTLLGGAQACHVFWQVGSSATLGTGTKFSGNILAQTSITLNTGANVSGRLLAQDGAVTLDNNSVTVAVCSVDPGGQNSVPDAANTAALFSFGLASVLVYRHQTLLRS